jgi:flagellin-like protein
MKISRSRKALSPVVASIILIAVTVAVSIAVAAWMGALTFNFMATEQLKITSVQFTNVTTTFYVSVTMLNTGTSTITVTEIHVNNGANLLTNSFSMTANTNSTTQVTMTPAWTSGGQYEVEVKTAKGNQFTYAATAPS